MSVLMEVSLLVGEDMGWEFRRIGGVAEEETERKEQEVGVLTGWEVGEIEGNYETMLKYFEIKERG